MSSIFHFFIFLLFFTLVRLFFLNRKDRVLEDDFKDDRDFLYTYPPRRERLLLRLCPYLVLPNFFEQPVIIYIYIQRKI